MASSGSGDSPPGGVVAVLDANVLIPPGLRDVLLSCAHVGVFRPVWQEEIEDEVIRNTVQLTMDRLGLEEVAAALGAKHTLTQMRTAFPDACAETALWAPLVPRMMCDEKDRHVLAVAVGAEATHLVTSNTRDFPVPSRPAGVAVVTPDRFLRDRLKASPDLVVEAVVAMSARLKSPRQSPGAIAGLLAAGPHAPRFGRELAAELGERSAH